MMAGTWLGFLMLPFLFQFKGIPDWWLGDGLSWARRLQAHGPMQVFGFCVIFTMGISYQMLGELLNARHSPNAMRLGLGCMVVGTLGQALTPQLLWSCLQLISGLMFVAGMARHRPSIGTARRNLAHSHFLRWGSLWLLVALALQVVGRPTALVLELILWGFLSLYIVGVGLRVHPAMLGRTPPAALLQWTVLWLWNGSLILHLANYPLPAAVGLFAASLLLVIGLRPWVYSANPHGWPLRGYLGWSYAWLLLASAGRLAAALPDGPAHWAGAVKHAHASGFILTMMVGMGLRLLPAFERKHLAWPAARWLCLGLLSLGGVLRVTGQAGVLPWALLPGGTLQVAALLLFAGSLLATFIRGQAIRTTGCARPSLEG